jgi:hypothetical protein
MQPASVEKLAWVLIFGGMIVFTLGLFMLRVGGGALSGPSSVRRSPRQRRAWC